MVVIDLGCSTVCMYPGGVAGKKGYFCLCASSWHRCLACESFFAPSKVSAAGSSAERGKERLMIGWVALNPFALGLGRSMGLVE